MPDIYNSNIPLTADTQSQNFDASAAPVTKLVPIAVPYGNDTEKRPLTDLEILQGSFNSAISYVNSQPWAKAEKYTSPLVKTPLEQTLRYNNPDIGYNPLDPNLEQRYAEDQGITHRFINRVAKMGGTAVVSFLDTIDATMNFISGNEAVTSTMSTGLNNWLQDLDNYILPNYETQQQKDHPYASYFTPWNFKSWVDNIGNVGQQLGYTIGAIAATVPLDIGLSMIGGEVAEAALVPKQLERIFSGLGKLGRMAADGGEEYNSFIQTVNSSENVVKGINKALTTTSNIKKAVDLTRFLTGVTISAYGESIVEANNTYSQIKKDLESKYVDEFGNFNGGDEIKGQIDQAAKAGAKSIVAPNFAFLALSNAIGYSSILKPAQAAIRETEKTLASEAKIVMDAKNPNKFISTPITGMWKRFTKPTSLIADNTREAFEEGYQYIFSNTAQNYYERQFNNDSTKDAVSLAQEYGKSFKDLFGTKAGFDNIFLGFLSGFAQHGIKGIYNRVVGNSQTPQQIADRITNSLNSVGVTDLFANTRKEAITAVGLANEITKANETGDIFQYKNLQHEQLFNFVSTAVNSHKFDARIEQLQALKGLSPENFNFVFGIESTDNNRQAMNEYVDNIISKAQDMKEDIQRINYVFGENPFAKTKDSDNYEAFNNYKTELSLNISKQKDLIARQKQVGEAIFGKLPTASMEDVSNLSTDEGITTNIEKYENKIKELTKSEDLAVGNAQLVNGYKKEKKFLEEKIGDLKGNLSEFDPDMYIQTLRELYNYHNNLDTLTGQSDINELDTLSVYNNSKDLNRLLKTSKDTIDYYRALAKKKGFDEFKNKYITARNNAYSLLTNQIDVDENGNMFFKPDDVVEEAIAPISPEALAEKIDAVDKATPEEIAKIMNPNYENEPESDEYKIAKGEIEVTDEIREAAKERIRSEQEAANVVVPQQKIKPAPTNETPEQRKERRAAVNTPSPVEVDYETREVETISTPKTAVEKVWDGLFSPIKMFFKLISQPARKDFKVDYRENLRSVLFGTSSKDDVEKVLNSVNIEISESKEGLASTEFAKYPIQKNIYRRGQALQIVLNVGTKPVGVLNEPDSLYYKEGEGYKPLHGITSATKYEEVTGNPANTFENFKQDSAIYKTAYNKLLTYQKDGEVSKVSNEQFREVFDTVISYGSIDYSTKAQDSTLLKDLKYKGKGSAILSFPMIYNEETDQYERQAFPNILNQNELSTEDLAAVSDFFDRNKALMESQNSRYAYLMKMPDGTFSSQSFIVARAANESESNIDEFFSNLKLSVQEARENKFTLKSINEFLGNALYISHSKQQYKRRTHIRFSVSNKGGDLALNIVNKQLKISSIIFITENELNSIPNMDAFIDYINNRIKAKEQTNTPLKSLGVSISKENFKKHLANDKEISSDDLRESLAASVKPNVFIDYSMTLSPVAAKIAPKKERIKAVEEVIKQPKATKEPKIYKVKKQREKVEPALSPRAIEIKTKYNSELKQFVEKRLGTASMSKEEVQNASQTEDVQSLLSYYEAQREAQVDNYMFDNVNYTPNTSFWDKKIKELREYMKIQNKKVAKKDNIVSKRQLDNFIDKNEVSEDVLQDIAQKLMDGDHLTAEEETVYKGRTAEVDGILKEIRDAEANALDVSKMEVTEGEKLVAEPDLPYSLEKGSPKKASPKVTTAAPIGFDINDIIAQLETKGIVKKDCE